MPLYPTSFFIPPTGVPYIVEDKYVRGGFRIVATMAERDAMGVASRKQGMRVFVLENFSEYQLVGGTGNANWQPYQASPKIHTHLAADITDLAAAISSNVTAMVGVPNGLADLGTDGKLRAQYLPAIAISDTFVVSSEAEQLALSATVGDVVVRTDLPGSFILQTEPASVLANWQELLTPGSPILSVNGQASGAVVLNAADVGAAAAVHAHAIGDVTGLQTVLDAKAAVAHTHAGSDISDLNFYLDQKANAAHDHTITNVTGLQAALDGKASSGHTHAISDVTMLQQELDAKVTQNDMNIALSGKADVDHAHTITEVTGLQTALDGKASSVHAHAINDVTGLQSALDGKASSVHAHAIADVTDLQSTLDGKASSVHAHAINDVTGLQAALDDKAASTHVHTIANVTGLQTALDNKFDKTGGTISGNVTITGDLTVQGASVTINASQLTVNDPIITAASGNTTAAAPYAGLKVERGSSDAFMVWNESLDRFVAYMSSDDLATVGTLTDIQAATFYGALSGNASTATKWATPRALTFTGDATGTGNIDGSAAVSIALTVGDDSHNHTISTITGLQTALDGKADSTHTHAVATTTVNGLMSSADKTKLDGVAAGANNYVHPTTDGNLHVPATSTTNNLKVLKAGATAGSIAWGNVAYSELTGIPSTFTPSAHTHAISDVTGLQTALDGKLATTGTAANSSQLQGFVTATGATANTVALRDSAGKITAVDFTMTSDARLKKIISDIDPDTALKAVLQWIPVLYSMKGDTRVMPGFIAQQLREVTPELVTMNDEEFLSVSYALSTAYLTAAIQAIAKKVL